MKVALCIPAYGMVHAKWTQSLLDMMNYTLAHAQLERDGEPVTVEFSTFIVSSSNLCESRHRLCAEAAMWEADYLLWLDADHVFPKDALCRLWARDVDIVGANYARRCIPTAPTAAKLVTGDRDKDHRNLVYTTKEKAEANEIEEVSHLGFGLVLMNRDILPCPGPAAVAFDEAAIVAVLANIAVVIVVGLAARAGAERRFAL